MSKSEKEKDEKHEGLVVRAVDEVVDDLSKAGKFVAEHVVGIRPTIIKSFARFGEWTRRTIKLTIPLVVLLFFTFASFLDDYMDPKARYALGIFIFVAMMWTFESLPLPVTALLVPVLLVVYGIFGAEPDPARAAFAPFATPVIYLVLGGIIISVAFRKTHLDERFAFWLVAKSKGDFDRLLLAIMLACGFLSMWISNTATAALLIPVAIGIASRAGASKEDSNQYSLLLLLGIGASAAIGGMATIVGTSANAVSSQFLAERLGAGNWTFLSWMKVGLPLSVLLLFLSWWLLVKLYPVSRKKLDIGWVDAELERMGELKSNEKKVLIILIGTIIFWMVGEEIASRLLPSPFVPGAFANAAIVSVIAAILLFVTRTLDWEDARLIPWGIFLIIGAGLALGQGLSVGGFNKWIGDQISGIAGPMVNWVVGAFALLIMISFLVVILSNFVNNTATVAFFIPLMITLAELISPGDIALVLLFSLPVALTAAVAFMTPVAHPPSTLIYGTGLVSKEDMFKSGLAITIPAVIVAVVWIYVVVGLGWI